jgi:hypothetical protein
MRNFRHGGVVPPCTESRILKHIVASRLPPLVLLVGCLLLSGCMVLAVADTVGTVAVKTVGLAADATIGAVKITGKAVGAAADVMLPDNEPAK